MTQYDKYKTTHSSFTFGDDDEQDRRDETDEQRVERAEKYRNQERTARSGRSGIGLLVYGFFTNDG